MVDGRLPCEKERAVILDEPMPTPVLGEATLEDLRLSLRGALILPDGPDSELAGAGGDDPADYRPALIVRCADADDVARAVQFARSYHLRLGVRGRGGEGPARARHGGALIVDLSRLKGIRLDPIRHTIWAEAGVTRAELRAALGARASGRPIAAMVGADGGEAAPGRRGLAWDDLTSVEIVVADGRRLVASRSEHPDLFWAIRSGASELGIITSFAYRLHPAGGDRTGAEIDPRCDEDEARVAAVRAIYDPSGFFSSHDGANQPLT
jgi:FAD/FMN-containing dehydrogenase